METISSSYIYQWQWASSGACIGPPTTMFGFAVDESMSPYAFSWLQEEISSPESCGFSPIAPLVSGCCFGSLDLEASGGVSSLMQSIAIAEQSEQAFKQWTPAAAIGYTYCTLNYPGNSSIITRYLLADSCQAIQFPAAGFNIACLKNGTLLLTDASEEAIAAPCGGPLIESFSASQQQESTQESIVFQGNVTVGLKTVNAGNQKTVWIAYFPTNLNIVKFDTPGRLFWLCLIASSCVCSLVASGWSIKRYYEESRSSHVISAVIHFLSLAATVIATIYCTVPIPSTFADDAYFETVNLLRGLVTLYLTLLNVSILFLVVPVLKNISKQKQYFVYAVIFVLHIVLDWTAYTGALINYYQLMWQFDSFAAPIWNFFAIISCSACIVGLMCFAIYNALFHEDAETRYQVSTIMSVISRLQWHSLLLALTLLNCIFFIVVQVFANYTLLLENDADVSLFWILCWIPFSFHGALTVMLVELNKRTRTLPRTPTKSAGANQTSRSAKQFSAGQLDNVVASD